MTKEQGIEQELQFLLDKFDAEIDQRGLTYMEVNVIQVTINQQHDKGLLKLQDQ